MNNQSQELSTIPPWVRHFLINVVKRCLGIIQKWIEDMQATNANIEK